VARSTFRSENTKHTILGPLLEVEMSEKCTPLRREAHLFRSQNVKNTRVRTTFGGSDVEKVHAVVARSTFRSQSVKSTRGSDHFWRCRCRLAWQAQGIVHLVKSEQNVSSIFNYNHHYTTLHSNTLHYITLHDTTFHYTSLHYTTLHNTTATTTQLHSTTLNYTTLNYTTLYYITLHYITLHYTTLHYITLNDTAPQRDR